jgi:hypothetical protein
MHSQYPYRNFLLFFIFINFVWYLLVYGLSSKKLEYELFLYYALINNSGDSTNNYRKKMR